MESEPLPKERSAGAGSADRSGAGAGRVERMCFSFSPPTPPACTQPSSALRWSGPRAGDGRTRPRCRRSPHGAAGRGSSIPAFYGPRCPPPCPQAAHRRSPLSRGKETQRPGEPLQKHGRRERRSHRDVHGVSTQPLPTRESRAEKA